jgi:hypothetical protein
MTHVLMARVSKNPEPWAWKGWIGQTPWEKRLATMDFLFSTGVIKNKMSPYKLFSDDVIVGANYFDLQRIIDMARTYTY